MRRLVARAWLAAVVVGAACAVARALWGAWHGGHAERGAVVAGLGVLALFGAVRLTLWAADNTE